MIQEFCLDARFGASRMHCSALCSIVAFCFYLVIIVQTLINQAQNIRLAKYNKTVQLVFDFIYI
jgi:hypothetical protein